MRHAFVLLAGCLSLLGCASDDKREPDGPEDASAPDGGEPHPEDASATDATMTSYDTGVADSGPIPVFASASFEVKRLALTSSHLYWTEADGIARMSLAGGDREVVATGQAAPSYLVIDGDDVFWINFGRRGTSNNVASSIAKTKVEGGSVEVLAENLVRGSLFRTFVDIQTDADSVYLLETGTPQSLYNDGAIQKLSKMSGPLTPIVSGLRSARALVHDATHFFHAWTNVNNDGSIDAYALDGAGPRALSSAGRGFAGLMLLGDDVWWANSAEPWTIRHMPKTGGSPVTFATGAASSVLRCLASDGTHVYWAESADGGSIMRMPLSGGQPMRIAPNPKECISLVVSESALYWTNERHVLFTAPK